MRKKMISVLGILSMVLLVAAICNPASAATYTVGVKVGDTADYTLSVTAANYTRAHIVVHGVVGTTVTLNMTSYDNASVAVNEDQVVGDIVTGSSLIWILLTGRNLNATDPVYSGATLTINETVQMDFAGASRQCNHIDYYGGAVDIYWDKATGIVTKANAFIFFGWMNMSMTATSLWPGGLFGLSTTTLIIIAVVGVVVVAAIVLVARRGKK
jgi:hypothetical protein